RLEPLGRRLDLYVFEDESAVARTEPEVFDLNLDGGGACGEKVQVHGIGEWQTTDGGDFAGHAVVAPEVRPVSDGLVVDFDDAIRGVFFNAFTLGGLHGDEAIERARVLRQAGD